MLALNETQTNPASDVESDYKGEPILSEEDIVQKVRSNTHQL